MMSLDQIVSLAEEQGRKASRLHKTPHVPFDKDEVNRFFDHPVGDFFTYLGTYRPAGWELVDYATVDKTGWGTEYEPAWTINHLHEFVLQTIDDGHQYGWAIIEEGEFQIVIGWFERTEPVSYDTKPSPFAGWYKCEDGYNEQ